MVAPVFGQLYIVPRLHEFFMSCPDIVVELRHRPHRQSGRGGHRLAIHNGDLKDSSLVAQRIAATPIVTVASPGYLKAHGTPASPSDLDNHRCIIFASHGAPRPWGFAGKFGDFEYRPHGGFRTNDADQIRAAVLANLGLAHTPGWLFAREIEAGRYVLCFATMNRRRLRSAPCTPPVGSWRPRFGSSLSFWPGSSPRN
jgi:LysR family transcriptional regulator, regulator for bpeEF and oprC